MSRLDTLPPDQRAVVQLVLRRGRSYAQLSELLGIAPDAVRGRARDALPALAPADAELEPATQGQLTDHLLGQQDEGQRARTNELLTSSAPARAWARGVSAELAPLADGALPEIPADPGKPGRRLGRRRAAPAPSGEPDPSGAQDRPPRRSSRVGGGILLGAGAVLIAAVIVLAITLLGGGSGDSSTTTAASGNGAKAASKSGNGGKKQAAGKGKKASASDAKVIQQVNLTAPSSGSTGTTSTGDSGPAGIAIVESAGKQLAALVSAQGLAPSDSDNPYAMWLASSDGSKAELLGYPVRSKNKPPVGKDGRLAASTPLPADAASYDELVLTRDARSNPKQMGEVVLSGTLDLKGKSGGSGSGG